MEEIVKKDLLSVLKATLETLNQPEPNIALLKKISNRTLHNASIYQDEHSISIAILIYSLSKILERIKDNQNYPKIVNLLALSIEYLEDDNIESYHDFITQIFSIIGKADKKFKLYIQEVIRQASIRKGSKLYEHGISASKTAQVLGISLWELYDYLGATNISDEDGDISSVRNRLKFTRGLFS